MTLRTNLSQTIMTRILMIAFLLQVFVSDATTSFMYGNDMTCESPVSISVEDASCGKNGGVCTFGDELHTYGTVTLKSDLSSSNLCVSIKACLNGKSWLCKTYTDEIDACNDMNLQGVNGQKCPSAGTYTFDADVTIPGSNLNLSNGRYMNFFFCQHLSCLVLQTQISERDNVLPYFW
jgi:hypothetical protein